MDRADRLRPMFTYLGSITSDAIPDGIAWRFGHGRTRRSYYLMYHAKKRAFFAIRKRYNGHGSVRKTVLPNKVGALFRSMLPDDQLARAMVLSLSGGEV